MILKREDLIKAYEHKKLENFDKALELFEKLYNEDPEQFTQKDKVNYAWTIIFVKMRDSRKEEFFTSAKFITDILTQEDVNTKSSCPYTAAVFKVLLKYKSDGNFIDMIPWLEMLDPELLDEKPHRSHGKQQKTRREMYYFCASKAYLDDFRLERCIEVSKEALQSLHNFNDDSQAWFKWRIAKSLNSLGRPDEALPYYMEVIKVKHDWYMYRDIADILYRLGRNYDAMDYLCQAVLAKGGYANKMGLYYLCYKVMKPFNPEMAIRHARFYLMLLNLKGYTAPYEIEQLNLDVSELNIMEVGAEITGLWTQYKYKDHKRHHGEVKRFFSDRNYGFITGEDGERIFFHRDDFLGEEIHDGQRVSYFIEDSFDRSKGKKSVKAVIVRGE